MTPLKYRELGTAQGICACCYANSHLTLVESRVVRTWRSRFDKGFDDHVLRTATCSVCHATYPVTVSDATPVLAAKRNLTPAATRTRRSTDLARLGTGRDWRDTGARV